MDNYTAAGIAEGFIEADSEEQIIEAWQHLHDTGLAYTLQGWFGRTARDLLERGIISYEPAIEVSAHPADVGPYSFTERVRAQQVHQARCCAAIASIGSR